MIFVSTTDYADETDLLLELLELLNLLNQYLEVRQKPDKPLGEDGGRCPAAMLPLWFYKSELLTPKPEAYHHLPSEGHHPHQGDKQE